MYIKLDYESEKYLYLQIYEKIKNLITKRDIKFGQKLPSIRNMATEYQVSINTVKKAYYQLEMEGYISCKEKSGFYVNKIEYLISNKPETPLKSKDKINFQYKYNFSFSGVDQENFPKYTISKLFKESMMKSDSKTINQRYMQGTYELRNAIGNYLKISRGINCKEENIIISSGTDNLFFILRKVLGKDTIFGFEDPGYPWGNSYFTYKLNSPVALEMDSNGITVQQLKEKNITTCLITPAHQFPTGIVMPITRRIQLLNWSMEEKQRYIIEDDYDGEFKYKGRVIPAMKSLENSHKVIYIGNFSKSLSPAIKISYMILPDELIKIYNEIFKDFSCPVSNFIQNTVTEFINQGYFEKHINTMRNIYFKKQQLILKTLSKCKKIKVNSSKSGTSVIIHIPNVNQEYITEQLKKNSIKLDPVNKFSINKELYKNYYILGYGTIEKEKIKSGIEKLIEIVEKY